MPLQRAHVTLYIAIANARIATMLARLEEAHLTQARDEAAKAIVSDTLWAFARNATKGKGKGDKGDRFEPT